ncbi:uncharacterized protein EV422DRAFT_618700 [Fimicolochytrium jonesii]|uniref:uncharacterized protein n=1 Tax=Fimicolochytrium jonesii TaxID=1396493 RepID=UPI0022FDBFF4|nr:uncharacterized protein EV422DRAFT_618700 [Fimicolochytrium jonesii]KAI8822987.1 hypothetical protein EV422DRAFT_618700 [Fimicolochytrium jonesii]
MSEVWQDPKDGDRRSAILQKTSLLHSAHYGSPEDRAVPRLCKGKRRQRQDRPSALDSLKTELAIRRALRLWTPCGYHNLWRGRRYNIVVLAEHRGVDRFVVRFSLSDSAPLAYLQAGAAAAALCSEEKVPTPQIFGTYRTVGLGNITSCIKPGRGYVFTRSTFIDGQRLSDLWPGASLCFKQTCLRSLACAYIPLMNREFDCIGTPQVKDDRKISIGPLYSHVLEAARDHGHVDFGPYRTWVSYATARLEALSIVFRHHSAIVHNLALLRPLVASVAAANGYTARDTFRLVHPDLHGGNIVVDATGNVRAIHDWDGARTQPLDYAAIYPPNEFVTNGPDEDEQDSQLMSWFCDTVRELDCPTWADSLGRFIGDGADHDAALYHPGHDFANVIENPLSLTPEEFGWALFYMLNRMKLARMLEVDVHIQKMPVPRKPRGARLAKTLRRMYRP